MVNAEIRQSFKSCAQQLGDFELLTKTELANGYCDATEAGNERLRSAYFAALMLRYWYKIQKTRAKNPINISEESAYDIVVHGLQYALTHQSWKDETKAVYNDPNGPDKIINRCIDSSYLIYMQTSNKDVRKANANNISIDKQIDDNGDSAINYLGCTDENDFIHGTKDVIEMFIKKNKLIEAIVVDGIVNGDSFKPNKDEPGDSFDMRKLVKHLNNINQKYVQEIFAKTYPIKESQQEELLLKLTGMSNTNLYKYIKKTLLEIKQSPELLSCIFNI